MADNITAPGPGEVLATDEISGVHFPRSKITLGADGVNDGDVSAANPMPVRPAPQGYWDVSFAQVGSGLLTPDFTLIRTGAGQTVNQSGGNLVITSGTTASAETVIRSARTFSGPLTLRQVTTLSQRILQNNFFVELVDVLGDNLAYTIVDTTTVDVTLPAHGFTAANVGQRIDLCALSSVGAGQQGVIASIPNADTIRFTVAGFPASGSGTLSLTGWNKVELLYSNTSPTLVSFTTRRRGWQNPAGGPTVATTASPGHMVHLSVDNGIVSLGSKATGAGTAIANSTALEQNIPLPEESLFIQIRSRNGGVAPASSTTWTIGMVRVEEYVPVQVNLTGTRQQSIANSLPVNVIGTVPVSGTVTATVGASITGGTISPLTVGSAIPLTSAARTTSGVTGVLTNASGSGGIFFINVTAVSGTTPTLVVRVQVQDPVSNAFVDIPGAVTPTITATGMTMLTICPGVVEAANSRVAFPLPRVYQVSWTIAGTTPSFTFSVGLAPVI